MEHPGSLTWQVTSGFGRDRPARFTGFGAQKAGFVASQVHITIGSHLLFCAPFKISSSRGVFLAVLRRPEADLFEGLRDTPCCATLAFERGGSSFSIRLQGSLERISALTGWPDACLLDLSLPKCPEDLMEVLGFIENSPTGGAASA